ncbi:flagellar assembly protein FliW [Bacillus sp. L381]|jgi:flagellar assembly factor FliW|uniref:Flagellar assembly factor FliW n=5 Tax=Bacilli TaxID=91061 RepID=FLIW_BACVZ|nr:MULTISPECIES: flagellar assembly protein FliW [Bacillus]A7Z9A7.1 RecName: Full=Flagellar assembly factor FliW [Bacillus velezensis FZB42]AIW31445.1 flagellar assembly protein FliW [Bacillus subtilis]ARM29369.1 flagellar assembly protein FliW [Bacillus vallismortis]MBL3613339.1 flagellar assembly protein FliW [Bacillus sp. RHFS18]SLB45310.1 Flagellar assembly factor FliW [Mycobacteroides abscessus subsp. massiliense]ABS75583.1 flagellar assembly protein FliW [Bacillus velezensis FZB42]
MIIKTKYHGEIRIDEGQIISFENGLPGFNDETQFVVLPLSEDSPFLALQSVKQEHIAFIVASPFIFFKGYEFDIDHATLELLHIEDIEDVEVMAILTLEEPFENTTANLKAPIIVNKKEMKAKQIILHDASYETKHLIGGGSC